MSTSSLFQSLRVKRVSPEAAGAVADLGVFAPLVGIIGSMQAAEALKLLCGAGESLAGRLLMLDALHMRWSEIGTRRAPGCKVCGKRSGAH